MPRSKSVNTYPPQLWTICERCAVGKEEFELEVPTVTKALSVQGQFYAFRGALRREYDRVAALGKDQAWEDKLKAYIEFSSLTVCWVDRPGKNDPVRQMTSPAKIRFMHRDKTPASELLEKALQTGRTPAQIADDADRSIEELLGKINPKLVVKGPDDGQTH